MVKAENIDLGLLKNIGCQRKDPLIKFQRCHGVMVRPSYKKKVTSVVGRNHSQRRKHDVSDTQNLLHVTHMFNNRE